MKKMALVFDVFDFTIHPHFDACCSINKCDLRKNRQDDGQYFGIRDVGVIV